MITSTNTTSAREIQRNYRKVVEKVKKTNQPIIVINRNKPDVAIMSIDALQEYNRLKSDKLDWSIIDEIRALNADKDPEEVYKEVTEEVEAVRQEKYEKEKKAQSNY